MDDVDDGRSEGRADRSRTGPARRRAARAAAALFVCALGSVPAAAQDNLPPVTVPLITDGRDDPPVVDPPTTPTTLPGMPTTTPPTTTPGPRPTPTTAPPVPATGPGPAADTRGRTRHRAITRPRATVPAEQPAPTSLVDTSHFVDREGRALDRLRDASIPAARQFGFPLGLGALVLGFLALQGRLDGRDPKLATAPVSVRDDLLSFS